MRLGLSSVAAIKPPPAQIRTGAVLCPHASAVGGNAHDVSGCGLHDQTKRTLPDALHDCQICCGFAPGGRSLSVLTAQNRRLLHAFQIERVWPNRGGRLSARWPGPRVVLLKEPAGISDANREYPERAIVWLRLLLRDKLKGVFDLPGGRLRVCGSCTGIIRALFYTLLLNTIWNETNYSCLD